MSCFRYPGGKSKLRDEIAKRLAEQANHEGLEYREPFFGGGSIGLKLLSDNSDITKVWINDKDIGIACLWTALINYHEDFKDRTRSFIPSVSGFYALQDELTNISSMPVQRAKIVDLGF
jgi:site-specific DNA-adenine methylase